MPGCFRLEPWFSLCFSLQHNVFLVSYIQKKYKYTSPLSKSRIVGSLVPGDSPWDIKTISFINSLQLKHSVYIQIHALCAYFFFSGFSSGLFSGLLSDISFGLFSDNSFVFFSLTFNFYHHMMNFIAMSFCSVIWTALSQIFRHTFLFHIISHFNDGRTGIDQRQAWILCQEWIGNWSTLFSTGLYARKSWFWICGLSRLLICV